MGEDILMLRFVFLRICLYIDFAFAEVNDSKENARHCIRALMTAFYVPRSTVG